jgi:uncharacterized protein YacL
LANHKNGYWIGFRPLPGASHPRYRRQSIALETSGTGLVLGLVLPILTFCAFNKLQLKAVIKMITIFFIAVNFYFNSKMKNLKRGNNSEYGGYWGS